MAPTTWPSTVTDAEVTRCTRMRTTVMLPCAPVTTTARSAVGEITRVLQLGGLLLFEKIPRRRRIREP
jgi:hypothetical protein